MKLGKTSLLLLIAGIIIVAFASLGVARAQQLQEQDRVSEELYLVARRLSTLRLEQLHTQHEELEKQLSQTTLQFEAVRAIFSQQIGSIGANDALFDIAQACGVEVTGITSSALLSGELEGVPCSVLTLGVSVEGDIPNLISFVLRVNGNFGSGAIDSVGINIPDETTEQRPAANIKLLIYNYYNYEGD